MANVYENVKKVLQDIIVPEIKEIQDEIKELRGEIKELRIEIKRLDEKIDFSLEFRERLSSLETKVASLSHS